MIPIGMVLSYTISVPAEIAQLAADNTLKFTGAALWAPGNVARIPNAVDPAYPGDGFCRYEFALPQSTANFSNFLGIWPKFTFGPDGQGVDRLFSNNDTPISFGDLGVPNGVLSGIGRQARRADRGRPAISIG